jgi:hypothetical protein
VDLRIFVRIPGDFGAFKMSQEDQSGFQDIRENFRECWINLEEFS